MTMKPSPLPWGWTYDGSSDYSIGPKDDPQSGVPVINVWSRDMGLAHKTCDFIVKACNSHAALVEALGDIVAQIEASGLAIKGVNLHKARAALALAEKP